MLGDTVALVEELTGRPQLRLADLWDLPDQTLMTLRPGFLPGVTVFAVDGRMCGRPGQGDPADLYGLEDPETFVLSRFDGRSTLANIVDELVAGCRWEPGAAQALAKNVFLRLVRLGLCAPANVVANHELPSSNNLDSCPGDHHE